MYLMFIVQNIIVKNIMHTAIIVYYILYNVQCVLYCTECTQHHIIFIKLFLLIQQPYGKIKKISPFTNHLNGACEKCFVIMT